MRASTTDDNAAFADSDKSNVKIYFLTVPKQNSNLITIHRKAIANCPADYLHQRQEREEIPPRDRIRFGALRCIILTVSNTYIDAGGYAHE